jgi:predicted RNase H-like HicB family nuclease
VVAVLVYVTVVVNAGMALQQADSGRDVAAMTQLELRKGPRGLAEAGARVRLGTAVSLVAMSTQREFDVVIMAEPEGGYSVFVPELPSVATQGETIEEARANAQEAIEGYLEVMHDDGLPIPMVHRDRVAVQAA